MALKIRLRQQGRTNRQTYRLVVTDIRNPRDGKYLEAVGFYNPLKADKNFSLNAERLTYWLSLGAELSENAEKLIAKEAPQIIQDLQAKRQAKRLKENAKRRQRKVKAAAASNKEVVAAQPKAEVKVAAEKKKAPVKRKTKE